MPTISTAQTWELGGFLGTAGYMGDLNPIDPLKVKNLAYGGFVKRNFDGYWSLKLNVQHGKIEAADADSKDPYFKSRNLSFFSPITEISAVTEFNFFRYIPSMSKKRYSPYLFVGAGIVTFDPQTIYNGDVIPLSEYGTEGQPVPKSYKKLDLTIPYGAGFKFNFSGKWNLGAELGYRTAFTDYLDDVSENYSSNRLSDRSPEAGFPPNLPGTQRGDYRKHDTYLFLGLTISYTFFTEKCPVVDN